MISKIFEYANDVSFDRFTRIRRAISNSGYVSSLKGSPTFYSVELNLKPLIKSEFDLVEAELISKEDGISTFNTQIPNKLNIINGDTTLTSITVDSNSSGTSLNLSSTSGLNVGDYIQVSSNDKVYQIKTIVDSNVVTLNTGLIENAAANDTVLIGQNVEFKLLLDNKPNVTIVPGPGFNYYQYSTFKFREIL
jgi:hypothetical protein